MRCLRTLRPTIAKRGKNMALKRDEKERIQDSLLKLQSVANSLDQVDSKEIPHLEDVQECFEGADEILGGAIRSPDSGETKK